MAFTFIHAADLHLGSPLAGLATKDAEIAERFATAGRQAFKDLVSQAIAREVAFVVLAGDVYDGDWSDHSIGLFFARELGRLDRAGIPVVLLKGNHDAESVISRSITLPESVLSFSSSRAETHRLEAHRVALHGRSFPNRAVEENFAASYPAVVPGWFNIGVLHTSCTGHPAHATYAPCSIADLAGRGYDYWALGHVHDHAVLCEDPWVVFPGNLQGRSIRECGPKGAVVVTVRDGRVADVSRLLVDLARFAQVSVDLTGFAEEREAIAAIEAALRPQSLAAEGRLLAVRLRLHGATALHDRLAADRPAFTAEVEAAGHRVHEDVWLERLSLDTERPARPQSPADQASGLDPIALIAEIDSDPDFQWRAKAALAEISERFPGGLDGERDAFNAELDALCAEAEALLLGRLAAARD